MKQPVTHAMERTWNAFSTEKKKHEHVRKAMKFSGCGTFPFSRAFFDVLLV